RAENVLVEVRLADGTLGFGGSLPRPFVTGETAEDVLENYRLGLSSRIGEPVPHFEDLVSLCLDDPLVDGGFETSLAGRCAMELALLDAGCKYFARRVLDTLMVAFPDICRPRPLNHVHYVVGLSSFTPVRELLSALEYRLAGFRSLKLKVGLDQADDLRKVKLIRRVLGWNVDLHADANGAWSLEEAVHVCRQLERYGLTMIEQPLAQGDEGSLPKLVRQIEMPVMLDESLTDLHHARLYARNGWCQVFNIRISKCGGLMPSCRLARLAHEEGLRWQLGCQVGELGVLSAAGRAMATAVADPVYCEGSYDRWLLKDNILADDISIGYRGRAPRLDGAGLGIEVDRRAIDRLTTEEVDLVLP
ncbi:MAG: mandelate racemase/muconate lactonizing enzyme family protein, partial [Planctomycetota bacterium]